MKPVLLTLGAVQISSFGLFLILALLAGLFVIWRLARVYDLDETKVFDITMTAFGVGFISSRLFFVLTNLKYFSSLDRVFLLIRYPGLSFWGGLIGGSAVLIILALRSKINFWLFLDCLVVGVLLGLSLGDFGCFLGGCDLGVTSQAFFATPVVGAIGKRFPVSVFESVIFLLLFLKLWKEVIRFHFAGKILALFLIYLGVIKFISDYFRVERGFGQLLSILLFTIGIVIFYKRAKRDLVSDLKMIQEILTSAKRRELTLLKIKKSWYNRQVTWQVGLINFWKALKSGPHFFESFKKWSLKIIKRRLNVKIP